MHACAHVHNLHLTDTTMCIVLKFVLIACAKGLHFSANTKVVIEKDAYFFLLDRLNPILLYCILHFLLEETFSSLCYSESIGWVKM